MAKKRFGDYTESRGLKAWNTRHTSNRAFMLREPEKTIALDGVCEVYRGAMRYAGLTPFDALDTDLPTQLTGAELRAIARGAAACDSWISRHPNSNQSPCRGDARPPEPALARRTTGARPG